MRSVGASKFNDNLFFVKKNYFQALLIDSRIGLEKSERINGTAEGAKKWHCPEVQEVTKCVR